MSAKNLTFLIIATFITTSAYSFCGFFVAKADTKLFNQASKVVLVRDENRTVLTMANDYQGELKDFAIVVPVPVVLKKEQVHIGDPKMLERLDAFSAPRLVEYFDRDPCAPVYPQALPSTALRKYAAGAAGGASVLGVKIEAQFTVGEYDIVILSAQESSGLETWLNQNGYKMPQGAAELLQPYIRSNTKFFVAKVNLAEYDNRGLTYLRPLQMAFESPKFMLPIRLGMANANKEQDLIVFALSRVGRTEVTNYRTVNIPSNFNLPIYVKNEFSDFYRAMFHRAYEKEGKNAVFVEYAWDMAWCDPCADQPLNPEELRKAGVFWLDEQNQNNVFITRIHACYSRSLFPEDLVFQSTPNRENYQGRYILQHPFKGKITCDAGKQYVRDLPKRQEKEAQSLASYTGWDINEIRKKMGLNQASGTTEDDSWWNKIFGDDDEKDD
ncbi:DUF2330 domain-containing protein [bacterium]|nr:DUF2330 domain-containing protein [bacterium]